MKLTIVENKYIFKDNLAIYSVLDAQYAQPIFEKINEVLAKNSPEAALLVLEKLVSAMPGKIRKMSDYDVLELNGINTESKTKKLGEKFTCERCNRKYYDILCIYKCPICLAPRTVNSSK